MAAHRIDAIHIPLLVRSSVNNSISFLSVKLSEMICVGYPLFLSALERSVKCAALENRSDTAR